MENKSNSPFSELELDALKEIMNISFGSAAAELTEVMDVFVELNIPNVTALKQADIFKYIQNDIPDFRDSWIVEQNFHGTFGGSAYLIYPYGIEKELISLFQNHDTQPYPSDELIELEKEVLMEIGNILIGACIGKIFDLMDSTISYLPPFITEGKNLQNFFDNNTENSSDIAITMKTVFSLEGQKISGNMFLIHNQDSIPLLKEALKKIFGI